MKDSDKVLVDTSSWIEFFNKKQPYYKVILELIDNDKVCCIGVILAELLQGAKSRKEFGVLKEFLYVFEFLPENIELWKRAGELSYLLRQKGKTIGLSDCYISATANSYNVKLLSLDRHFKTIVKETSLKLYTIT
ncbi:MAG: hypothetical protein SCARUB_02552 [Candidatus Scalindua rubra]|uniref:Ribonuclease VapC n=1 Tax=Candidatus Scalindua rubra TaxID=1872076 RepID=A0A1E3XBH3_9BACT|nr:MAG: hypothetical protein SCARUB_02552 [Candidatus Scalindua rubra]